MGGCYLRVTAEGCGDNGKALNDAIPAPQVHLLQPGARDYAVAQRRQHYLQHQKQRERRGGGVGSAHTKGAKDGRGKGEWEG